MSNEQIVNEHLQANSTCLCHLHVDIEGTNCSVDMDFFSHVLSTCVQCTCRMNTHSVSVI
jgi:hypothetical protein